MKVYIVVGIDETPIGSYSIVDRVFDNKESAEKRKKDLEIEQVIYDCKVVEREMEK